MKLEQIINSIKCLFRTPRFFKGQWIFFNGKEKLVTDIIYFFKANQIYYELNNEYFCYYGEDLLRQQNKDKIENYFLDYYVNLDKLKIWGEQEKDNFLNKRFLERQ